MGSESDWSPDRFGEGATRSRSRRVEPFIRRWRWLESPAWRSSIARMYSRPKSVGAKQQADAPLARSLCSQHRPLPSRQDNHEPAAVSERQLADGCWGISLATFHQVRAARRLGFDRIFYANELVGLQEIAFVLREMSADLAFDFYCLVDSIDGVERLRRSAEESPPGRPLQVLVEGGFPGGRCGVRTVESALDVARAVHANSPHLRLVGLEGYEGVLQTRPRDERQPPYPHSLKPSSR
ncbi:alanine racemase [Mesorhizobium sp.]|uniref:alanine racemase n=1 Tax=Mesorhizobium sp. TaxID=1871066 RepID=UPI0026BDC403